LKSFSWEDCNLHPLKRGIAFNSVNFSALHKPLFFISSNIKIILDKLLLQLKENSVGEDAWDSRSGACGLEFFGHAH